nr:hypothetical protein RAR13_09330 [Aminobacter aminovorans]
MLIVCVGLIVLQGSELVAKRDQTKGSGNLMSEIHLRELTESEFLDCSRGSMSDVTSAQQPVADVWPYVDLLDPRSVGVLAIRDVEYVYRDASQRYDHVVIATDTADIFLVVIVDRRAKRVLGHRLLDLLVEYGLASRH